MYPAKPADSFVIIAKGILPVLSVCEPCTRRPRAVSCNRLTLHEVCCILHTVYRTCVLTGTGILAGLTPEVAGEAQHDLASIAAVTRACVLCLPCHLSR